MARTRKPPEQRTPDTKPADPMGMHVVTLPPARTGGVRVTEATALTLGAVWACVKVVSEDLAKLPWGVYRRRGDGGRERLAAHPADWLLGMQANPETPAYHWREALLAHALTWRTGYAETERDAAGRVLWLWQLTPDRVSVERTRRGQIVYDVTNPGAPNTVLSADDTYHLRGPGFDGLVGYSVIRVASRSVGLGIGLEENA